MDKAKMEKQVDLTDSAEENEPVFYTHKRLSLVSDTASILSWFVLVGFAGDIVAQVVSIHSQFTSQGLLLANLLKEPSFISYVFVNLVIPLLTGLGLFAVLQAASVGLNVLFEMDFDAREARSEQQA